MMMSSSNWFDWWFFAIHPFLSLIGVFGTKVGLVVFKFTVVSRVFLFSKVCLFYFVFC